MTTRAKFAGRVKQRQTLALARLRNSLAKHHTNQDKEKVRITLQEIQNLEAKGIS